MSISDKDIGYKKILKDLVSLQNISLSVGIHGDVNDYKDGATTAAIAAVHEFGSITNNIPERSFLRSTIDENQSVYFDLIESKISDAIDGKGTVFAGMEFVGSILKGDVQQKITDIKEPANAEATRKRKEKLGGTANPLLDTGHMRSSIDYKVGI